MERLEFADFELEGAAEGPCNVVTSKDLISYHCAYSSFRVFHQPNDLAVAPRLVYETNLAVTQVRPSKLDSDSFISFIQAKDADDL